VHGRQDRGRIDC